MKKAFSRKIVLSNPQEANQQETFNFKYIKTVTETN